MSKAQQIASIVKAAKGQVVSYKDIAAQMQVSLQSVTGSVASLKKDTSFTFVQGGIQSVVEKKERVARVDTKQSKANAVLTRFFGGGEFQRKDLIASLMTEANLTKNGANTYIQNYKIKNGLIGKK